MIVHSRHAMKESRWRGIKRERESTKYYFPLSAVAFCWPDNAITQNECSYIHTAAIQILVSTFSVSLRASARRRHSWSLRESHLSSVLVAMLSFSQRNKFIHVLLIHTNSMEKKRMLAISRVCCLLFLSFLIHVHLNDEIKFTEPLWMVEQCDLRVKIMHIGIVSMRHAHTNVSLIFISISKIIT